MTSPLTERTTPSAASSPADLPAWALYPRPHLHGVAVAIAIRGGPRYEGRGEQGLTHFMEHMVFRGAGSHGTLAELMGAFERVGAEPEAYTSEDSITLLLELDPARLDEGIALLADILLRPAWRDLESERALILE